MNALVTLTLEVFSLSVPIPFCQMIKPHVTTRMTLGNDVTFEKRGCHRRARTIFAVRCKMTPCSGH